MAIVLPAAGSLEKDRRFYVHSKIIVLATVKRKNLTVNFYFQTFYKLKTRTLRPEREKFGGIYTAVPEKCT